MFQFRPAWYKKCPVIVCAQRNGTLTVGICLKRCTMKLEKEALQNQMISHLLWGVLCLMTFVATGLACTLQGSVDGNLEIHKVLQEARKAATGTPEGCNLLRRIARTQAKAGDMEGAVQTAADSPDSCSRYAFQEVNAVLGDVNRALQIAAGIGDDHAKTNALWAIVESQAAAGHVHVAEQAAVEIPDGTDWKATVLATVARAQIKAGDRRGALQTLEQALQAATHLRKDSRRASALEEIASAQAEAGDILGALTTVQQVPEAQKYHYVLHSDLMTQLAEAGDVKGALQIAAEIGNATVRDSAWQEIAAAQAKAGEMREAMQTADHIRGETEKANALRMIGAVQWSAGDHAGATKTFEQVLRTATHIQKPVDKWNTLSEIAEAQAETRDYRGAVQTADTILDEPAKDRALSAIAMIQVKAGDNERALRTAARARSNFVKPNVLWAIAQAQLKTGNVQGALETVASFPSNMQKASFICSTGAAQARAGDHAGVAKMVEMVLQTAATIQAGSEKANFLIAGASPIWGAQARVGDRTGATKTLEQTFQAVATIRLDIPERASALGVIARDQSGRSVVDYVGAAKTIEQALRTVDLIRESFKGKERVLANIAAAQAAVGDIHGAMQTFSGIKGEGDRGQALNAIARAQAKSGDLRGAYALATSQRSSSGKANALLDVAEGILDRGNAEQSRIVSVKR